MRLQFLIPIAGIVSTWLALSIIWWSLQRRKEREAFYRHELARRMVERYDEGQQQVLEWLREQDAADARRAREVLQAVGWVLLFGGSAALIGLGFTPRDESLFGLVPIGVALGIFAYLLQTRRR
jgi:hypothetical protein